MGTAFFVARSPRHRHRNPHMKAENGHRLSTTASSQRLHSVFAGGDLHSSLHSSPSSIIVTPPQQRHMSENQFAASPSPSMLRVSENSIAVTHSILRQMSETPVTPVMSSMSRN